MDIHVDYLFVINLKINHLILTVNSFHYISVHYKTKFLIEGTCQNKTFLRNKNESALLFSPDTPYTGILLTDLKSRTPVVSKLTVKRVGIY